MTDYFRFTLEKLDVYVLIDSYHSPIHEEAENNQAVKKKDDEKDFKYIEE